MKNDKTLQLFFGENLFIGMKDFFLRLRDRLIELEMDPDTYGLPKGNMDTIHSRKFMAAAQVVLGISIIMLPFALVGECDIKKALAKIPKLMADRNIEPGSDRAVTSIVQMFRLGMTSFEKIGELEVFAEARNWQSLQNDYSFGTVAMTVAVEMMLDKDQNAVAA